MTNCPGGGGGDGSTGTGDGSGRAAGIAVGGGTRGGGTNTPAACGGRGTSAAFDAVARGTLHAINYTPDDDGTGRVTLTGPYRNAHGHETTGETRPSDNLSPTPPPPPPQPATPRKRT